jgi:hypothetical protein
VDRITRTRSLSASEAVYQNALAGPEPEAHRDRSTAPPTSAGLDARAFVLLKWKDLTAETKQIQYGCRET